MREDQPPADRPTGAGQIIQVTAFDNGRAVTITTPDDTVGTSVLNVLNSKNASLVMSDNTPMTTTGPKGTSGDPVAGGSGLTGPTTTAATLPPPAGPSTLSRGSPTQVVRMVGPSHHLATSPNSDPLWATSNQVRGGHGWLTASSPPPTTSSPQMFGPLPAVQLVRHHNQIKLYVNPGANGPDLQRALNLDLILNLDFSLGDVKRNFKAYIPCNNYQVGRCDNPNFSHPSYTQPNGRWYSHICKICYVRSRLPFHHNVSTCPFAITTLDNTTLP